MGLLTPEERQKLLKEKGLALKYKCDYKECGRPIFSTLTYSGKQGHLYDTRECLEAAEPDMAISRPIRKDKEKQEPMIEKKKKKKKHSEEDDSEREVKKKKKKKKDKSSDKSEKSEKKKSSSGEKSDGPFRDGSSIGKAFAMCRAGTTRSKIQRMCDDEGIGSARIFHWMKKGEFGDFKWRYIEDDDGHIKIKMRS